MQRIRVVRPISFRRATRLVCEYHYSGNCPTLTYAFALYVNKALEGVCCFGTGANYVLMKLVQKEGWNFLELVRLCLKNNEKNDASYLIGKALKHLPRSTLIVSYADLHWGHSGKVYQATNWIYTGIGALGIQYSLDGKLIHKKSIRDKLGTNKQECLTRVWGNRVKKKATLGKHRYFYCLGKSKRETKRMKEWVIANYGVQSYPKKESCRYDVKELRALERQSHRLKPMF